PVTAPGATCLWTQVSYNWNSGASTTANIAIYNRNFAGGGNDFALDDIALRETTTCLYQATVTVTVSPPGTTPIFSPVNAICAGETINPLPTTSNNGISGSWSPTLNNTATTTYTFTPSAGQCAMTASMTISVSQPVVPVFTSVAPICAGNSLNPLPTTSNNGINGTWSPAVNNTTTTTYTFTPSAGECAVSTTITIVVNQSSVTPTFTAIAPICSGSMLNPLPTTSNDGIVGTWSPAIDNTTTTTYTFTPAAGQCASLTTMTITVNPAVNPTFSTIAPICAGDELDDLPTTSDNGITGTWSPALDNLSTTTYTFTPSAGQCASTATLTITVKAPIAFSISEACNGTLYTLGAVQDSATNPTYAWFDPSGVQIGTSSSVVIASPGLYELEITQEGCSNSERINVISTACAIQKGISANNDGMNDYFDLEAYNVKKLNIYNRYGVSIYSKTGYQNQWYGQSDSGNELPDGTYYYVIDFDDQNSKTGWIYLIRTQ
ncbi:MAG: gliding motility-associated C-terminal domain-containing protein, partial [Flavobacterium sp.]|nr:gliding motility-associated C-terminal domain-containing protein [Flavobacterium sp.]